MIFLDIKASKSMLLTTMFLLLHGLLLLGVSMATSIKKGCTSGEISELKVHCNSESSYLVLCSESTQAEVEIRITYSKRVFHINSDVGLPMEILWNSHMHNKALVRIGFAPKQYTYIMTARELQITVTNNASIYYIMCNTPINQCDVTLEEDSQFSYDPPYFTLDTSIENYQPDFVGFDTEFICSEDSYGLYESKLEEESSDGENWDVDYDEQDVEESKDDDDDGDGTSDGENWNDIILDKLTKADYKKDDMEEGSADGQHWDINLDELTMSNSDYKKYDMEEGSADGKYWDNILDEMNMADFLKGDMEEGSDEINMPDFEQDDMEEGSALGDQQDDMIEDYIIDNKQDMSDMSDNIQDDVTEMSTIDNKQEDMTDISSIDNIQDDMTEMSTIDNKQDDLAKGSTINNEQGDMVENSTVIDKQDKMAEYSTIDNKQNDMAESTTKNNKQDEMVENSTIIDKQDKMAEYSTIDNKQDDMAESTTKNDKQDEMEKRSTVVKEQVDESWHTNNSDSHRDNRGSPRPSSYTSLLALMLGGASVTIFLVFVLLSLIKCYKRKKGHGTTQENIPVTEKKPMPV